MKIRLHLCHLWLSKVSITSPPFSFHGLFRNSSQKCYLILCQQLNNLNLKDKTMHQNRFQYWILSLLIMAAALLLAPTARAQQACFTEQDRARAEQTAKVWRAPDPGYDPVLGYNPATGPRRGSPPVDSNGLAMRIN